jgi:hypothetical protein
MSILTPEVEYIGDLARAWARGVTGTVPPLAELDGDRFLRLLAGQPAMQTVARFVDRSVLPGAEVSRFDRAVEISRRRTTIMLLELERVLAALAEVGCQPVVLKGASLALTAYEAPEDRWFVDLDLLVPPEEQATVYDVLDRLGYRFSEPRHAVKYYQKYHFHRILTSNQGICIEVHWAVTLPRSIYRFDLDALRARAGKHPLGKLSLRAPHAVDQILHGVLQSIPSGYADLRRLLDLHRLDALIDDDDRHELCRQAADCRLRTGLWLQYRLRETVLGFEIPAVVERKCRPSPTLRRIFEGLDLTAGCLAHGTSRFDGFTELVHLLCTPPRQRARALGRFALPSEEMYLHAGLELGHLPSAIDMLLYLARRAVTTGRMTGHLIRAAV